MAINSADGWRWLSFKKQDQLQRHGSGSPERLTADTSLSAHSRIVIVQEESHSEKRVMRCVLGLALNLETFANCECHL